MHHTNGDGATWKGVIAGAVGGVIGAWAMEQFQSWWSRSVDDGNDAMQRWSGEEPAWDGRTQDQEKGHAEPATVKAVAAVAEPMLGRELTKAEKNVAGPLAHYAFGALAGAVYGAIAERNRAMTMGGGVPYGATVWLVADELGVPAAGLSSPPTEHRPEAHLYSFGSHVVYGLTLEGSRRLVRSVF